MTFVQIQHDDGSVFCVHRLRDFRKMHPTVPVPTGKSGRAQIPGGSFVTVRRIQSRKVKARAS